MIYNIIPFVIILVSLATIIVVVVRKFPALTKMDVTKLQVEKDNCAKKEIIWRRFKRHFSENVGKVKRKTSPHLQKIQGGMSDFHRKVKELHDNLEEKVKQGQASSKGGSKALSEEEILVKKAVKALDDDRLKEAEDFFIKAIALNRKNFKAYEGLGLVYYLNKDYDKAKETLMFLIKLAKKIEKSNNCVNGFDLSKYYFLYARAVKETGNYGEAWEYFENAYKLDLKNPKYLDMLIQMGILLKDWELARNYLNKLKIVNPDNRKIIELEEKIDAIRKK